MENYAFEFIPVILLCSSTCQSPHGPETVRREWKKRKERNAVRKSWANTLA